MNDDYNVGDIADKFSKLDYFTQRTIMHEFPEVFPKPKQYHAREFYPTPERRFRMSEFFGGFMIVLYSIGILATILQWMGF